MRAVRPLVKSTLNSLGFDLVRHVPSAPLEVFDPIVRARAAANPEFFFLQVGANDGVRHDPLRQIVLEYHLRGLCVEPLPDMFDAPARHDPLTIAHP
jgi:hypothetical protein